MTRSAGAHAAIGLAAWAVPLAITFFCTPFIVNGLGAADYGVLTLLTSFGVYSIQHGIGKAVIRYAPLVSSDSATAASALSPVAVRLTALWTAANILLLLSIAWLALRTTVSSHSLLLALGLVAATLAATGTRDLYLPIAQIIGRFPASSAVIALSSSGALLGGAGIALLTGSWLAVGAWHSTMAVVGAVAAFGITRSARTGAQHHTTLTLPRSSAVLRYGTVAAAPQMIGSIIALGERVAVATWIGSAAVGGYSLAWMLALAIHGAVANAGTIFPVTASRLPPETLATTYEHAMGVALLTIVTLAAVACACGPTFLRLWVGGSTAEYAAMSLIPLTVAAAVLAALVLPWMVAESRGFADLNLKLLASCAILMMFLGPLMLPHGLFWFSSARGLSLAGAPVYIIAVERRVFGAVRRDFWLRSGTRLVLIGGAAWLVTALLAGPTWTQLGVAVGAGVLTSGMAAYIVGYKPLHDMLSSGTATSTLRRQA